MRPSVRAAFVAFSASLEGVVRWMYLDVYGLVTTGIGNLIDASARGGPAVPPSTFPAFERPDGSRATLEEVLAEWWTVKNHPTAARDGHRVLERVTRLRLTDESLDALVLGKLAANDVDLLRRFPAMGEWPADAQLATHSMAWACGTGFRFPRLEQALRTLVFESAAIECQMDARGNPGLVPRNARNAMLYRNAAAVDARGLDPARLYYPRELPLDDEPDTLPSASIPPPPATLPDFDVVYAMPEPPPFDE